jgi:sugar lactone lactonase YvrE
MQVSDDQIVKIAAKVLAYENTSEDFIGTDVHMNNSVAFDPDNRNNYFSIRYRKDIHVADVSLFLHTKKVATFKMKFNLAIIDGFKIPGRLTLTMDNVATTHVVLPHFVTLNQYSRRKLL